MTADEVGLDVLSQILWPAIAAAIVSNLGNTIFAAGRPDELHKVGPDHHRLLKALIKIALHGSPQIHHTLRINGTFLRIYNSNATKYGIYNFRASLAASRLFPITLEGDCGDVRVVSRQPLYGGRMGIRTDGSSLESLVDLLEV